MRRLYFLCLGLLLALQAYGQSAREQIRENVLLAASNYLAYQAPSSSLTPSPKGYEPFYMSQYGRHGSRWLTSDALYTDVINVLKDAKKYGKLSQTGQETLDKLVSFHSTTLDRAGELTEVGERQWHEIGQRMTQNFPEIFSKDAKVDARATVVIRCILSMEAACEELAKFNPGIRFHNDVSQSFQYYLNQSRSAQIKAASKKGEAVWEEYKTKVLRPSRLCSVLFNDQEYVYNNVDARDFMVGLFDIASNMQSHDDAPDLFGLFTEDEIYDLWRTYNIGWYTQYGPSPVSDGLIPYSQENLLRNIIETSDSIVSSKTFNGATLRFGHEICVMPLASLMELGNCNAQVTDLDHLEDYWRNYEIFPMASNIQLVFYRPKKGKDGDILVKALLNESEVTLPATAVMGPYYRWDDLRRYYTDKLDTFDRDLKQ